MKLIVCLERIPRQLQAQLPGDHQQGSSKRWPGSGTVEARGGGPDRGPGIPGVLPAGDPAVRPGLRLFVPSAPLVRRLPVEYGSPDPRNTAPSDPGQMWVVPQGSWAASVTVTDCAWRVSSSSLAARRSSAVVRRPRAAACSAADRMGCSSDRVLQRQGSAVFDGRERDVLHLGVGSGCSIPIDSPAGAMGYRCRLFIFRN